MRQNDKTEVQNFFPKTMRRSRPGWQLGRLAGLRPADFELVTFWSPCPYRLLLRSLRSLRIQGARPPARRK